MPTKMRYCLLCRQYDRRRSRRSFLRISTIEREEKLRESYRRRYNGEEINQPVLNQIVHQKCYNKIIQQDLPLIDRIHSTDNISNANEENSDGKQDQESEVQSRSTLITSNQPKTVQERSKRACVICHSYAYSYTNRIRQVASNFMANRLAQGFLRRYKRPYGKSFLDAHIHEACYRKIYSYYRTQALRKLNNQHYLPYQSRVNHSLKISPHETRSRSNVNHEETVDTTITDLFSAPFSIPVATSSPNAELSARSGLFRPCIQRLPQEQVDFYTKRNDISKDIPVILDQLPVTYASTIQILSTDHPMIDINENNDLDTNEEDLSPFHSTVILPVKTTTTAEIRYRHSKPTNSPSIIHRPVINARSEKYLPHLDKLYHWLMEQLKSSECPIPISEALTKYHEYIAEKEHEEETIDSQKNANLGRVQLRNRLEKFYPNEFVFVVPNKRDGTHIALNDINHYICSIIKKAQQDKESATKTSMVSSIIVPPTPVDEKRKTCETIMDGIRKIRLYIHDPKQINCLPSNLMQNFIGLLTASDRQFEKISHNYDFYRMIDENLFDDTEDQRSKKLNKTIRNMSLASDLISARHDHQISQKHYLLADEIAKDTFHCTPRQVITLLNRYGHTCSYRSYAKMKTIVQRTTDELGQTLLIDQEQPEDIETDLMDL